MSETTKKRRTRSGHRAYVTKKLTKVKELTENLSPDVTYDRFDPIDADVIGKD